VDLLALEHPLIGGNTVLLITLDGESNFGQIIVYLNEKTKVPDIIRFADKVRSALASFPGVKIEVKRFQQGPPISAPIEMRIMGNNLDTLDILSTKVEKLMKEKSGSMYVRNDLKYVKSDIVVDVDREKAGLYGISSAEIAKTVRLAIVGLQIGEISNSEGDDYN
jgi:multidrug efflux pump subunit AcrB